jgi:hypothetical protein
MKRYPTSNWLPCQIFVKSLEQVIHVTELIVAEAKALAARAANASSAINAEQPDLVYSDVRDLMSRIHSSHTGAPGKASSSSTLSDGLSEPSHLPSYPPRPPRQNGQQMQQPERMEESRYDEDGNEHVHTIHDAAEQVKRYEDFTTIGEYSSRSDI